jgi:hypothetical protein
MATMRIRKIAGGSNGTTSQAIKPLHPEKLTST